MQMHLISFGLTKLYLFNITESVAIFGEICVINLPRQPHNNNPFSENNSLTGKIKIRIHVCSDENTFNE